MSDPTTLNGQADTIAQLEALVDSFHLLWVNAKGRVHDLRVQHDHDRDTTVDLRHALRDTRDNLDRARDFAAACEAENARLLEGMDQAAQYVRTLDCTCEEDWCDIDGPPCDRCITLGWLQHVTVPERDLICDTALAAIRG